MFLRLRILFLLMIMATAINARSFGDNFKATPPDKGWFMGAGVGTQFYVGDGDGLQSAGYRVSTAMEGSVGKWITSSLAARIQGNAAHVTGGKPDGSKEAMNLINIHADLMVDCFNVFMGVDEERKFTILPLIGVGMAATGKTRQCFSLNVGAEALFRINKHVNLFTELKGVLLNDKMDGTVGGFKGEGAAFLTAGFYYCF